VDRSTAPWRVLEDPVADHPSDDDRSASSSDEGLAGIPVSWLVAGAIAIMIALALVGVILASGSSPIVKVLADDGGGTGAASPIGSADAAAGAELVVEVAGAVAHPGLYHLPPGGRVADAITAAGGFGPRVDAARAAAQLNLAAHVADGDRILVPSRDDPSPPPGGPVIGGAGGGAAPAGGAAAGPVDLNRATAAELDALPGIGPVTAAKIIAARQERPFASVDDLRTRKLVGQSTFEKLRSLVVVR
jgi:competence protein ComEA